MRWPLRSQILLPMLGLMVLTLLALSVANSYLAARRSRGRIERQLAEVSQTLSQARFPLTDSVLQQTRGLSGAEFILVHQGGHVVAASHPRFKHTFNPESVAEVTGTHWEQVEELAGERYFHTSVPLKRLGDQTPALLHILYPVASYDEAWRDAVVPPLVLGGVALILVGILSTVLALRVTRPLGDLSRQVERIAQGDREPMPAPRRDDEVADLATAINRMTEMLAQYEDEVRRSERLRTLGQLGGGIAHQLRNSVTGCRMALDLHRRRCQGGDGEESLNVAVRQLGLMEAYLQRFLKHGDPHQVTKRTVQLREVLAEVLALVGPSARHVGITLESEVPESGELAVHGDAIALEQLLASLVVNAVEAASLSREGSPPQSEREARCVRVCLSAEGESARFEIHDNGPGPASELSSRLFEPLVTDKPDGVGLGLALARRIVQEHDGTISWHRESPWTTFVVELPLLTKVSANGASACC